MIDILYNQLKADFSITRIKKWQKMVVFTYLYVTAMIYESTNGTIEIYATLTFNKPYNRSFLLEKLNMLNRNSKYKHVLESGNNEFVVSYTLHNEALLEEIFAFCEHLICIRDIVQETN